jgi:hypothetical protein
MRLTIPLRLLIIFIIIACILFFLYHTRNHYRGKGAGSAQQALTQFIDACEAKDYATIREVVYYKRWNCGGAECIALDINDPNAIDKMVQDHFELDPRSMANFFGPLYWGHDFYPRFRELWLQRLSPLRDNFQLYVPLLRSLHPEAGLDQVEIELEYPLLVRRSLSEPWKPSSRQTCSIKLIQVEKRWYVSNFTCNSLGLLEGHESLQQ